MNRIGLLTGTLLTVTLTFGQVNVLETIVEPPKFTGHQVLDYEIEEGVSPICNYLVNNLNPYTSFNEGVVVLLFTVKADGTVTEFNITNSVSKTNDNAIIACIKNTSKMWQPGLVNGNPVDMEKEVHVKFIDPDKPSLEEQARKNIVVAVKKYHVAKHIKKSTFITYERIQRKSDRKLKNSLRLLEIANRLQPNEPSIVFWQACTYGEQGNDLMRSEMLKRFNEMLDPYYQASLENVHIVLK
jgi:hypothetical protein